MGIEAKLVTVKLVRIFLKQSVDVLVSELKSTVSSILCFLRHAMNRGTWVVKCLVLDFSAQVMISEL